MAYKTTTPEIVVAKLARDILKSRSRFVRSTWAAGPVLDGFKTQARQNPESSEYRSGVRAGNNFEKSNDPKACAWCAEGAIMKAAGDLGMSENAAYACIATVDRYVPGKSIQSISDLKGHAVTVKAMSKAIAEMEAQFAKEQKKEAC